MELIEEDVELCPHCGQRQKEEQPSFCIKANTILWGRYLVGKMCGQDNIGIIYTGYDYKENTKVLIKEYHPGVNVCDSTVDSQTWKKECGNFIKEAENSPDVKETFMANGTAYAVMAYTDENHQTGENPAEHPQHDNGKAEVPKQKNKKFSGKWKAAVIAVMTVIATAVVILAAVGIYEKIDSNGEDSQKVTASEASVSDEAALETESGKMEETEENATSLAKESSKSETATAQAEDVTRNILMKDSDFYKKGDEVRIGMVFESDISRESILSITFLNSFESMPDTAWDVSWMQDGTVMAWTMPDENNAEMYHLFIAAQGSVRGKDCFCLFAGYNNMKEINFNGNFDTSIVTDMGWMFGHCGNLTELDLSGFDTSGVQDMRDMFEGCKSLTKLDMSGFDTGNVTNMGWMFYGCEGLQSLDVSNFNTSKVQNMNAMFDECKSLTELNVSGFDTGSVTDMGWMFYGCEGLQSLDVSNFNTSKAQDMQSMFDKCKSLTKLDVSGFDTGNVTNMGWMFYYCEGLQSLDVSNFNTSKVQNMQSMFGICGGLTSLDVSSFDTGNVTNMKWMFGDCGKLTELDVSGFVIGSETDTSDMFTNCGITAEQAGLKTK